LGIDFHTPADKDEPIRVLFVLNGHDYSRNFKTPTLVTQRRVRLPRPADAGPGYYNTLRIKDVPTRLVYFPDEDHSILKPQNSVLWYSEVFAWLDKYIGHGPTE
jgi:hypothetical protein